MRGPRRGTSGATQILVILAKPEDTDETTVIRRILARLEDRPGVEVTVWFLRDYHRTRPRGSRNVDALRTWWLNRLLELVGLERVAAGARGLRLRGWFARLDPDLVLCDDGLGARLLGAARRRPIVVDREREEPSDTYGFDEPRVTEPDAIVSLRRRPDDHPVPAERWIPWPIRLDDNAANRERAEVRRRRDAIGRAGTGVPDDVTLVVGRGEDSWVDGVDLFVRILWFLEHRHGVVAHGLWIGPLDAVEHDSVTAEAVRCGLEGRVHLLEDAPDEQLWAGDLVVLPSRVGIDPEFAEQAGVCKTGVVTFEPGLRPVPWLRTVPFLDLAAAASAAADLLVEDRAAWPHPFDIDPFVDRLLGLLDDGRDPGHRAP